MSDMSKEFANFTPLEQVIVIPSPRFRQAQPEILEGGPDYPDQYSSEAVQTREAEGFWASLSAGLASRLERVHHFAARFGAPAGGAAASLLLAASCERVANPPAVVQEVSQPQEAAEPEISSEAVERTPEDNNGVQFGQEGREPEASPPIQELPPGTLSAGVEAAETEPEEEPQEPPARHTPTLDDLKPPRPTPTAAATSTPPPTTPPTVAPTQEQPKEEVSPEPPKAPPPPTPTTVATKAPEPTATPTTAPTQETQRTSEEEDYSIITEDGTRLFKMREIPYSFLNFSPENERLMRDYFSRLKGEDARITFRGREISVYNYIRTGPIALVRFDPSSNLAGQAIDLTNDPNFRRLGLGGIIILGPTGLYHSFEFWAANSAHEITHTRQFLDGTYGEQEAEEIEAQVMSALSR